ncbi:MAG: YjbQ family protein [Candidatus Omnitrophica bacterium]|nr:YjbQ family protein [Candidatus Omnitrophota bacterium]
MNTRVIEFSTKGNTHILNITPELDRILREENVRDGILFLSAIGSTGGITTMEYEPGLEKDLRQTFEQLFPYKTNYAHNSTWADDNGHSHLRSSFLKTSSFVSVTGGKLDLGTWQQVVFIDFDTRPRDRRILVKIVT